MAKSKKTKRRGSRSGGLSGMRQGMKSLVGTGAKKGKKPESTLSKVIWYVILGAALGGVIYYRFLRK